MPEGSFVAMRTDSAKRWPNQDQMQNEDANGTKHYPGWSMEALTYLYETPKITASGHETTDTDTDPGPRFGHCEQREVISLPGRLVLRQTDFERF